MAETERKSRIPPNSKESEMMVLGCMLTNINALNIGADSLVDKDFYYTEHQTIFNALSSAYRSDKPADIHLIGEELKRQNKLEAVGGISYLTTLAQYAGTSAFIEEYVSLIRDKSILRQMVNAAQTIEKTALEEPADVTGALDEAQSQLFKISQETQQNAGVTLKDLISGLKAESKLPYLKELQERQQAYQEKGPDDSTVTGFPTHFIDLDKMLNGFNPSNLMILAARPAMGKCVTGDTSILDPETGALVPIKKLVEKGSGNVVTLGKDWKLHKTEPVAYVPDGLKPTFRLRTALGREIEATAVHPLLTILGWKRLEELKVGERIAVPRSLPFFGKSSWQKHRLKMLAYLLADGNLTNLQPRFTNNNPKIVADFIEAAHEFGPVCIRKDERSNRIPAYSISLDKTLYQNLRKQFSKALQSLSYVRKKIAYQLVEGLGFSKTLVCHWATAQAIPSYQTALSLEEEFPELPFLTSLNRKNPITEFLTELGIMGKNAHEKFIPEPIFQLCKENLALFINRLFSCDGTAYVANCGGNPFPVIAYSSVSKTLIHQVQHLLLRFGVICKIRAKTSRLNGKDFASFELEIHGKEDLIRFCKEIGCPIRTGEM
jgi:replicative DNA helicase